MPLESRSLQSCESWIHLSYWYLLWLLMSLNAQSRQSRLHLSILNFSRASKTLDPHLDISHGAIIVGVSGDDNVDILHNSVEGLNCLRGKNVYRTPACLIAPFLRLGHGSVSKTKSFANGRTNQNTCMYANSAIQSSSRNTDPILDVLTDGPISLINSPIS